MENGTVIPVVSNCRQKSYEDEPLWIIAMMVASVNFNGDGDGFENETHARNRA